MSATRAQLKKLSETIPFKWRVQSFSKNYASAQVVGYIDARAVMDHLDQHVGPENWSSDYKEVHGNLFGGIGIWVLVGPGDRLIEKWDCGTESQTEKEKGEASDAFKRAAVKWNVGRFLYDLPLISMKSNAPKGSHNYVVDENGKQVWDVSEYVNRTQKAKIAKALEAIAKKRAALDAQGISNDTLEVSNDAEEEEEETAEVEDTPPPKKAAPAKAEPKAEAPAKKKNPLAAKRAEIRRLIPLKDRWSESMVTRYASEKLKFPGKAGIDELPEEILDKVIDALNRSKDKTEE